MVLETYYVSTGELVGPFLQPCGIMYSTTTGFSRDLLRSAKYEAARVLAVPPRTAARVRRAFCTRCGDESRSSGAARRLRRRACQLAVDIGNAPPDAPESACRGTAICRAACPVTPLHLRGAVPSRRSRSALSTRNSARYACFRRAQPPAPC